ncbi:dTDP-4-dehydrorhamnose reductase [bacterium]|jgi:dTDP-4-dehydrorhamnose reductase|nr:dTDP-4-dehydrorhamnose reductase [bacterium]
MNIVILGSNGMIGTDMMDVLSKGTHTLTGLTLDDIDITNKKDVNNLKSIVSQKNNSASHPINIIINCAAYTQVDLCETNKETAFSVNGIGVGLLAQFCKTNDITLIHFSTDYIFDGEKTEPYIETDQTNPISVYGESKLMGDKLIESSGCKHYIFRIQWVFGEHGNHFVKTIQTLNKTKSEISVVNDQWGCPSWSYNICECVLKIINQAIPFGTYHLTHPEGTNWFEFAKQIVKSLNLSLKIQATDSDTFKRPASRPLNGRLNAGKLGAYDIVMNDWTLSLNQFLNNK